MDAFETLLDRARSNPMNIVLAEGEDQRIIEAAGQCVREGIARITLLGDEQRIASALDALGYKGEQIEIINPAASDRLDNYAEAFFEMRRRKGVTQEQARDTVVRPLYFGNMMVRSGDADGSVAGAVNTTADTVRAALQVIGLEPSRAIVSSFFIMILSEPYHKIKGTLVFADCGLVVDPSAEELAEIAMTSADSAQSLLGIEPRVVMLSFSTNRSAKHEMVDRVVAASEIVKQRRPEMLIDGDTQFDAGIVPEIAASKAPGSRVAGQGNVMIFPNLMAGNIGYKIAQRIGGAKAIGPILQGLKKPANDLSRGCSPDDVFRVAAVTAVQAQAAKSS